MIHLKASTRFAGACAACLLAIAGPARADEPVKIYLMAGQSNMVGWGNWYTEKDGDVLVDNLDDPANPYALTATQVTTYNTALNDVWVAHPEGDKATGPLAPGFGGNTSKIGVEVGMGHTLADANTNPFFLYKSDKGGTTLGGNWLPPTAAQTHGRDVGELYIKAVQQYHQLLADLDSQYGDYNGAGYEVAGFVWLQGWNEYGNSGYLSEYQQNVVDLANDIRQDLGIADLPVLIVDCPRDVTSATHQQLATSKQLAVADLNAQMPGSAVYVDSLGLDPVSGQAFFHWNYNAPYYVEMGNRIGTAAQTLMRPSPVNHEGDADIASAWDRFRDNYNRTMRYEMEAPSGTDVSNTAGDGSVIDAVLSSETARSTIGLGPGSTGSIDANQGVIRATHDLGGSARNFTFGAWIQLDEGLADAQADFIFMSGEDSPSTGANSGYNFGVQRKQIGGQWENTLYLDTNKFTGTATNDSLGRGDILLEEGQAYFVAFVRNHDLTPSGSPDSDDNTVFYLYDPLTDTLHTNDAGKGSRQGVVSFLNTRIGIGLDGSNTSENPATQFPGLIDDAQLWNISLTEADILALAQQGSLFVDAALPGDFDGDGDIDGVDVAEMFSNFNGPGGGVPSNPLTDIDGDGDADGVDVATLFGLFTGPLTPANVPEPTGLALLGLGGLVFMRRRRV